MKDAAEEKRLRELTLAKLDGHHETRRKTILASNEVRDVLRERKAKLYAERRRSIVAGNVAECSRLNAEIKSINDQIFAIGAQDMEQAEADAMELKELLRPGEESPK